MYYQNYEDYMKNVLGNNNQIEYVNSPSRQIYPYSYIPTYTQPIDVNPVNNFNASNIQNQQPLNIAREPVMQTSETIPVNANASNTNNEIARMYPDLKDEMDRINSNMVDFLEPFKKREYYTKEMHGSASIKAVLPALYPNDPELDYHNLPVVHNGEEASDAFLSLKGKSKEEQEKIRHGLLVYCELDTYAMVKIWMKFNEIIGEERYE